MHVDYVLYIIIMNTYNLVQCNGLNEPVLGDGKAMKSLAVKSLGMRNGGEGSLGIRERIIIYVCVYVCRCMHMYVYVYVCTCTYTCICIYIYIYIHIHVHVHVHVYVYIIQ